MDVRLEFTVEPFLEGSPGPHVRAAVDEARRQGLAPEMGPFGTTIDGEAARLLPGLGAIVGAAVDAGASRVAFAVSRRQAVPTHPFLTALAPLADALGAQVVPSDDMAP
ncbi:MAG: hypothetical protein QOJ52_3835, partial [Acidimicrobiaceae bacterium]|nr:hypothetical protein [Acidimicrobiaceae bacterium]